MNNLRPSWAEVDVGAIAANARTLAALVAPAQLCAVVKAGGYGHGAVRAAESALDGGATWLAVALVEEGVELRDAGITAPILLLSEPPVGAFADVVAADLRPTVYTAAGIEAAARAVASAAGVARAGYRRAGVDPAVGRRAQTGVWTARDWRPDPGLGADGDRPLAVHLKVDTGMHRVGASPEVAADLAGAVVAHPELFLEGLWTHFAVADEPDRDGFTQGQLDRLLETGAGLALQGIRAPLLHAANSAGAIAHPVARLDLVRCGIALYGLAPSPALAGRVPLRPALSLKARVSHVKEVPAGEGVSYGLRWSAPEPTIVATVPLGYADGVPRRLSGLGGEVLLRGRRVAMVGTITMDQLLVDCGPRSDVGAGDEVVLIGRQGAEEISAWDWAARLGTIGYEVVCGIGGRVPRITT